MKALQTNGKTTVKQLSDPNNHILNFLIISVIKVNFGILSAEIIFNIDLLFIVKC